MRNMLILSIIVIILVGCNANEKEANNSDEKVVVQYKLSYEEVVGYSDSDPMYEPIMESTKLLYSEDDVFEFYNKYFKSRELLVERPDSKNVLVFMQFNGNSTSARQYNVDEVFVLGNKLNIIASEGSNISVSPAGGNDMYFNYVMLLEISRDQLEGIDGIILSTN